MGKDTQNYQLELDFSRRLFRQVFVQTAEILTTVLSHGTSQSRYTAANVAIGNSVQNSVTKPFMSLPLAAMKTEPAKNTVISLPLATAMADPIKNAIMSLPLAAVRADQTWFMTIGACFVSGLAATGLCNMVGV
jgi:hypothetical protein